jgi:hypothetical protein
MEFNVDPYYMLCQEDAIAILLNKIFLISLMKMEIGMCIDNLKFKKFRKYIFSKINIINYSTYSIIKNYF